MIQAPPVTTWLPQYLPGCQAARWRCQVLQPLESSAGSLSRTVLRYAAALRMRSPQHHRLLLPRQSSRSSGGGSGGGRGF